MAPHNNLYRIEAGGSLHLSFHAAQQALWDSQRRFNFFIAGTQSGKCLRATSLVLLADGTRKSVAQVVPGDKINVLGSTLRIEHSEVTASFATGVQPLFRVTTASGRQIEVTAEHPLYSERGWRPAGEFAVGDFIGVPRGYPELGTQTAVPAEMKLLGYLLGDGGLTNTSPMFTNVDAEILGDLRSCLPPAYALAPSGRYGYRISEGLGQGQHWDKRSKRFAGGTNPVIEKCKTWGIWGKLAKVKRIPEFVFTLERRWIAPLLNALYSCDGTVDSKGVEIVLASEGLIDDLQHLLLRFGIVARKSYKAARYKNKVFDSWRLSFADRASLQVFATEIGFTGAKCAALQALLDRKAEQRPNGKDLAIDFPLAACLAKQGDPRPSKHGGHVDQVGHTLLRGARRQHVARAYAQALATHFGVGAREAWSDIYWDTVTAIKPLGPQPTWDLTVAQGHNFVANDVFAHNSSFCPWWLWREIRLRGGGDYLAVTPSYDLFKLKLLPEMLQVFVNVLKCGRFWSGERVLELSKDLVPGAFQARMTTDPMWGRIILRSASSEGGLESATAKAAILDEVGQPEFALEAWEAVLRRLALHTGRVLGTTTPYTLGWLKSEVFDRWLAGDPNFMVVQADSTMNPAFPRAEFERARATMSAWKFNMFYRGRFDRPASLIYGEFHEERHVVDAFPLNVNWPRFVGVDPGSVHQGMVWVALDPDTGLYYVYDESLEGHKTTQESAQAAKEKAKGLYIARWTGGAKSEHQIRWDWQQYGVSLQEPPFGEVEAGIDRINMLLKTNRLRVFRNCRLLRDEFGRYSRETNPAGEPLETIANKGDYHALDALRYCIAGALVASWSFAALGDQVKTENRWNI